MKHNPMLFYARNYHYVHHEKIIFNHLAPRSPSMLVEG